MSNAQITCINSVSHCKVLRLISLQYDVTVAFLLPCCAGSIIRWEQQVRFRHMTTRQYLCITADKRVTITPDCRDPRTVFRLHPVIKVRTQAQSVVKHLSNFTLSDCCEMEMILAFTDLIFTCILTLFVPTLFFVV